MNDPSQGVERVLFGTRIESDLTEPTGTTSPLPRGSASSSTPVGSSSSDRFEDAKARARAAQWHEAELQKREEDLLAFQESLDKREELLNRHEALFRDRVDGSEAAQFVRIASHDLRAPLKGIYSYCQILEESLDDDLTDHQRTYADRIRTYAESAVRLVDDLSTMTRLEPEGLTASSCDLNELVAAALSSHESLLADGGRSMVVEPLPVVWGFRDLLHKALTRLIDNAIMYSAIGHQISIVRLDAPVPPLDSRTHFTLHIANEIADDSVVLIDGAARRRADSNELLLPLVRGTQNGTGSGMGLAICRQVVDLHGGKIAVSAQDPGWFSVWVTLPFTATGSGEKRAS